MSQTLTLYTNPMSRGQIARWMLEEVGAPYETVLLDYGTTMKAPDYLAINPMGKVPAIVHDGRVVTECAAICAYLADAFPAANLAPPPADCHAYYRWLFFAAGPVESAVTNRALGFVLPEGRDRTAGYGTFDATMDALESAIATGPWICGDQFTAADVYVGAQIDWGLTFQSIPSRPAFERYAARLRTRPAYQRQKATDSALIAAMQKQG
ncbi:glutathione S-transferase family protein [Sphingobium sp. HBC34]|uniref:Glutathione S-transferase family protein n=1 Tax=Sphingobium cyanobacteriorum TaxID=3063954 RepID=A0ABT8ZK94_9SPHN|nr:glutathione S-transferase family protein [Sphingobium sp. HBC34]MDO7834950.1 glutathione S-transferase family protein [Sphingobium sp. HBC34]